MFIAEVKRLIGLQKIKMIAKNKADELFEKHKGNIEACFITATQVLTELKRNELNTKFWINVIRELETIKKGLKT